MTLTIDELFQPRLSGVGPNVPPGGSWLSVLITDAQTLGLPTTSWQPGQPERTILSIDAVEFSQMDALISQIAQGGFLDFAASGTVTYVALNGQTVTFPVTPDPSIPSQNPTGRPGWLDELGTSSYDEERIPATYASGPLSFVNRSASTLGPFLAGTYHAANYLTKKTYSNLASLSIPPSAIAGTGGIITAVSVGLPTTITTQSAHGLALGAVVFIDDTRGVSGLNGVFAQVAAATATTIQIAVTTAGTWTGGGSVFACTTATMRADLIGPDSDAAPGSVIAPITQLTSVSIFNVTSWAGAQWESNLAYAARCRLKLAAISPNGASAAFEYVALTAVRLLGEEDPPITLTNGPIISAITSANPVTGELTTTIASSSPASSVLGAAVTPGCAQLAVTSVSGTPCTVTTASPHGLTSGNVATVANVVGVPEANTTTTVTVVTSTSFELDGTTPSGSYIGGGTVEGGDLGQVDRLLQNTCVNDTTIAFTASALALPIAVSAIVSVPQAFVATYQAAVGNALVRYFASLPIGGNVGVVPISAVDGILFNSGVVPGALPFVQSISALTINGVAADVTYPTNQYQALSGVNTISVVGV